MLKEAYHCEQVAQVKDVMRKEVLAVGPDTSILDLAEMMMGQKPKILSGGGGGTPARGDQSPQRDAGHPCPARHLLRAPGQSLTLPVSRHS